MTNFVQYFACEIDVKHTRIMTADEIFFSFSVLCMMLIYVLNLRQDKQRVSPLT